MTTTIPPELYYSKNHEWARIEGETVSVGITEFAVEQMNREIINLDLPELGRLIKQDESFGIVDSVKAAFDLYAPVSGEIIEVNQALPSHPELVANSPYGDGWMIKIKASNLQPEIKNLLTPEQYKQMISQE